MTKKIEQCLYKLIENDNEDIQFRQHPKAPLNSPVMGSNKVEFFKSAGGISDVKKKI